MPRRGCCCSTGPSSADGIAPGSAEALRARQLRPRARLGAGQALAAAGASALIDISDGLGADAGHLAAASGVRIELDLGAVAVQPGVPRSPVRRARTPSSMAASGGEDYELLAAVPQTSVDGALAAVRDAGLDPAVVGGVETGEGVVLRSSKGRVLNARGYDQVSSRVPAEPT